MSFVQSHREITLSRGHGPAGQDGEIDTVYDFDLPLFWNVDKYAMPRFLQPKRFRMSIDHDVTGLAAVGVQKPKASGSLRSLS